MIPWYYRWRFTNWLMAEPWKWNYRVLYRNIRAENIYVFANGREYIDYGHGRLQSTWLALTFPHVHHESEE